MYLKITNKEEIHYYLQYHDGLIIDPIPFEREGSCCPGGIYFTTPEFICYFINYGPWIREVTIPEDAEMVQDPQGDKWRASKVILSPRKSLSEVDTWKWLIECGVDIHVDNDRLFWLCASNGSLEVVKYLIEFSVDIDIDAKNFALQYSAQHGHLEVVKFLVEKDITIHTENDYALRWSALNGHLEVVKFLVEQGANIHADDDFALRYSALYRHFEIAKYLIEKGADIHANADESIGYLINCGLV
jgi:hypothetical protein